MASNTYHEPLELLSEATRDTHRALVSLMEELEAIDWYQQRADACSDPQLATVLLHNKNEEIEHAAMVLEWLRRRDAHLDDMLRKYLFAVAPIVEIEKSAAIAGSAASSFDTLGVGSMKGR